MECDGTDSGPVQGLKTGSGKKLGLGLDVECAIRKPRAEKMDGEKLGNKKRFTQIGTGFVSVDDEPIGSLFNLKSRRNPKKVKLDLDGAGDKGKQVEVRVEKLVVKNEDLGGMNDTLASFRKKLKGPKKDSGASLTTGRDLSNNAVEPVGQSSNGPVKDAGLAAKSISKTVEKGHMTGEDGIGGTVKKRSQKSAKEKSRRSKSTSLLKNTGGIVESANVLDGQRSGENLSLDEKECILELEGGSSPCSDEHLEDSLSAFFRKVQSGLIRKSRSPLRSKEVNITQASKDELSPGPNSVLDDFLPLTVRNQSASQLAAKISGSSDSLLPVSYGGTMDSTRDQNQIMGHQKSDDSLSQVSKCIQASPSSGDPTQEPSSAPVLTNENLLASVGAHDGSSERILEVTVSISSSEISQSCSKSFSDKTRRLENNEVTRASAETHEGHPEEPPDSNHIPDRNPDQFHCSKAREECYLPSEDSTMNNVEDDLIHYSTWKASDLVHDVAEMPKSLSVVEQMQTVCHFREGVPTGGFIGNLDEQSKVVSTSPISTTDQKISSPFGKDVQGDSSGEAICSDGMKQISDKDLEPSASPSPNLMTHNENIRVTLKPLGGLGFDHCQNDFRHLQLSSSSSAFRSPKREVTSHDCDSPNRIRVTCTKEPDIASVSSQKEDASISDGRLSPVSLGGSDKYESAIRGNHLGKSLDIADEEAPSTTPDRNETYANDTGSIPGPESKDNKQLRGQRAVRNAKRHRHGDMAYEGDADWEVLIHEQDFLVSHQVEDKDQPFKTKGRLNSLSTMALEAESGGAAAVSAGLKAHAAGPVEKIKFKEVLKCKGGLQEYIECRNHILHLWNKDVSRILPLSECGVSDIAGVDEHPHVSLVRDIYAFLDHCGYINVGVASEKEIAVAGVKHKFRLLGENNIEGKSGAPVADSDDAILNNENKAAKGDTDTMTVYLQTQESSTATECEGRVADDYQENNGIDAKRPSKVVNLDLLSSIPCTDMQEDGAVLVRVPELPKCSYDVQLASTDYKEARHFMQCNSETRKRIIVIGAGPAGLTAARHLHRQGFHVTVLEARSRIGGRVFTDRSSLSVPVDLGASIITGVEADVATERRPDPSSLVCQQLDLELTVLNSDCPLYDIATGKKVPADLDEALESEYNSLLDDMLLLVAQKGDHAMRMSLEDGLEYALKVRRMARSGKKCVESEKSSSEGEILSPLERRVMDWHFANLEYGCAALLKEVSLPYWNQDDVYGGFGGAHCMIKGGYSTVVDSLGEGLRIHLNHVVTDVSYHSEDHVTDDNQFNKVKVSTSNGKDFTGDAVLVTVPLGCLKAETIKFSPQLPQWKYSSIQRLGFGVLNKVVLEFSEVFWDDSVDYFGATADETDQRGWCFMFWNVRKTVGAPVLIALVVGKAAINGQNISSSDHVHHALAVLRKLFGEVAVPDPVASIVTDWGRDPFSYGAYSYVAVGASGEDYDILGRPIKNCLFFAGEATCKEHPDTVGGAMMSGLREAVRIIDILNTGTDYTAEVETMEAAQRHSDSERSEVRDIIRRLDAVELSNVLYKNSLDGTQIVTREGLLQDMFSNAKTTAGRLHLVKELLNLPAEVLKSFAGTKQGLSILNSWILDSMGKDGTQLLRHCVRLLVRVSIDLLAVRLSGIGKTVKEKVCVHTSRDIRAIASQLVSVWVEIFRKEKASNGGLKLLRQSTAVDISKSKSNLAFGKPPLRGHHASSENRGSKSSATAGNQLLANANNRKMDVTPVKLETRTDSKSEIKPSKSQGSVGRQDSKEEDTDFAMSKEEQVAFAAAEAAHAAAIAAAEAYASSGAKCNTQLQLPKIPSFHKFARREQYAQMDDAEFKRKWSGGILGRQDCISEIDSRNCRVRDWSVDFSAAGVNLDSSKMSVDNHSQRSHSNENACQLNYREHSGESAAVESNIFTKAWVDSAGSEGIKDYNAIERWQSQAAAADSDFFHRTMHIMDEEESNMSSKPSIRKHDGLANESSASQVTVNRELVGNQPRGAENIKQAVVDYVASLLMPLYKARKIDKEGYKSIMKKTATKVMEQTTDAEKAMAVFEFLDFKRKNKIRAFVDKLIERHMAMKAGVKS